MDRRCIARNATGDPCQAQPVRPSGYCWFHDPAIAEERERKRREGGANRSNAARVRRKLAGDLKDLAGVKAMLLEAMQATKDGDLEPGILTALSTAARAVVAVAGVADFEAELAQMRADIAAFTERTGDAS